METDKSSRLLNSFIETELNAIKEAYAASNLEDCHLDAGLAIAWSCYMFKNWVSEDISNELTEFAVELAHSNDNDWVWLASLLSAAHLVKENEDIRDQLLNQVSHGTAAHRYEVVRAVTFMVPTVSFSNSYLKKAVITNIERIQDLYEESVILYLCTEGSADDKRRWALDAKKRFNKLDDHKTFFEELFQKNKYYQNAFFVDTFSAAKSYFIFRLLAEPTLGHKQSGLFNEKADAREIVQNLQEREQNHPLSQSYIDLSCLKEKKTGLFKQD